MPKLKESSRALLVQWVPQAIEQGWTIEKLGQQCHCGDRAAGEAMRRYRGDMQTATLATAQNIAETMRGEALRIRGTTLARLPRLERVLDRALEAAEKSSDPRQLTAVVKAYGELWKLAKDVSGLALVEDVAKVKAIAAAKCEPVFTSACDVEVIFDE